MEDICCSFPNTFGIFHDDRSIPEWEIVRIILGDDVTTEGTLQNAAAWPCELLAIIDMITAIHAVNTNVFLLLNDAVVIGNSLLHFAIEVP
jgi:hypothetical protein